ncbi:MAG: alginate export family protein [bacterium]|nr:alginate export family protein [bacterium]
MWRSLFIGVVGGTLLAGAGSVAAQENQPSADQQPQPEPVEVTEQQTTVRTDVPPAEAPPPEAPLPGPKYFNLRFLDDFSYLDGPEGSYRKDFFDPIKNIRLGDDLRLSIGGEFRFRMESHTNLAFDARPQTEDTFQLYRYLLHADFKYRKLARFFFQGIAAFDEDRDLPLRGIDENRFDVHQAFFDVRFLGEDIPLTLRMGRQEFQFGKQRFISPLDWANVRRRFDAVSIFWRSEKFDADFFYAEPVVVKRKQGDDWNEEFDFYGMYLTCRAIPRHGIDVYFFAEDNTGSNLNPNGSRGDISRYTLGTRFWGKTAGFDYDTELSGQWGRWAGHTIQAWSWSAEGGYTFADWPWKPRLGAGFDFATGDENASDGKVGTFGQLFPLGHAYFGYLDLIGRQNVTATRVELSAWPVAKKVKARMAYHAFWLNDNRDALYNAGGRPGRRDPTGNSGAEVGHELDLTLLWKINTHQTLLLGYSHFWDSSFIIQTGKSEDPDMFYIQYAFKF